MNGEPGDTEPLRVGVLADHGLLAWQRSTLDLLPVESEVVAFVSPNEAPRARRGPLEELLYRIYSQLDRAGLSPRPSAFAVASPARAPRPALHITVSPRRTRFSDHIEGEDLEKIRALDLDVLIRFGFRILRGEILSIPRYGVWSYHHDDERLVRGGPPGFWEVIENHPTTGVVLQQLTETLDGGTVLERGRSPTHHSSVIRNRNHVYWKATQFVPRQLERLARDPETWQQRVQERNNKAPHVYSSRLYRNPGSLQLAWPLARWAARTTVQTVYRRLTRDQWFLAYGRSPTGAALSPPLYRFRELVPPRGTSWADPFPLEHQGTAFVFLEEYRHATRRGHLSVMQMGSNGPSGAPQPILEEPHHLSHPFLFEWKGDLFLIPESAANRTVDLYRCKRFPAQWEHVHRLFERIRAVDATLHQDGDTWWLFMNMALDQETHAHDDLHLYYSDRPTGGWQPHPMNPIVADCRHARPAGNLFHHHGALYRPGQDCAIRYGHSIVFNRVDELTKTTYRETPTTRILPNWRKGLLATHTFNRAGGFVLVDGMQRRRRW
jgi:hypothetical protein